MQNDGNNSGGTIRGYVVVEHRFCNGHHDHAVTHAFGELAAAQKHVEGRIEQITRRDSGYAADETWLLNHDDHPTLHAVSPRIFAKAQDHLSRGHDYEGFAYRLGTAIARHTEESEGSRVKYPYTYKVGETEVFCTKSESADATAASARRAVVNRSRGKSSMPRQ